MESLTSAEEAKKLGNEELLQRLSSGASGLSGAEARERLARYGYNEIAERKVSLLARLASYFWGPIPWMIEVAAFLSAVLRRWDDFGIIFVLLLLNAGVGFWQEYKAENAIELLKQRLALMARVLRDGKWERVPARELVPGDVARVRLGDIIPADIKLLSGPYLLMDESALTGESLPVEKHAEDIGYAGSVARQGEMNALVFATGMETFLGRTARLVSEARTRSHFQQAVIRIGNYLIGIAIVLAATIILVAVVRHESLLQIIQFALVLTVAAIPVALPAVLSVTMAVGAVALTRKEAIVSKLVAIEEMAGMSVLCSDKTGTITKNELTVGEVIPSDGFTSRDVLLLGTLASREENRDPIDDAVITKARSLPGSGSAAAAPKVVGFRPFDPVSKLAEATVEDAEGNHFRVAKGAPQVILSLAADREAIGAEVNERVGALAARGYRALGVARTDAQGSWHFAGLLGLYDPPREDSAETIETAQSMGIEVKMVTGDHGAIAAEVARQVHLGTNIQPASAFLDKSQPEALLLVHGSDGFSQVFPEHKYHIVELLQQAGDIVGMTGDGVNDAPALKKADVGIAVVGSTDAAKSAADIVLTRPGLSVIIDAIKESRKVFQRMNSYAIYRIAETIRVLLFITLSILVFNFYPVTAIMIVLLALFNDAPIMAIAYDNVRYSKEPDKWDMGMVLGVATVVGLAGVLSSFTLFYIGEVVLRFSRATIQSLIFLKLAVAGHLTIFVTRTRGPFWSTRPSAALFWSAVVTKLVATLVVVYGWWVVPIGWELAGLVWAYALVSAFLFTDFLKTATYRLLVRLRA